MRAHIYYVYALFHRGDEQQTTRVYDPSYTYYICLLLVLFIITIITKIRGALSPIQRRTLLLHRATDAATAPCTHRRRWHDARKPFRRREQTWWRRCVYAQLPPEASLVKSPPAARSSDLTRWWLSYSFVPIYYYKNHRYVLTKYIVKRFTRQCLQWIKFQIFFSQAVGYFLYNFLDSVRSEFYIFYL